MLTNFSGVKPHEWWTWLRCVSITLPFSKCNQDENVDDDLTCGKSAAPSNALNDSNVFLQEPSNWESLTWIHRLSMVSSFGELQNTLVEYLIDKPDHERNLDENNLHLLSI